MSVILEAIPYKRYEEENSSRKLLLPQPILDSEAGLEIHNILTIFQILCNTKLNPFCSPMSEFWTLFSLKHNYVSDLIY